MLPKLRRCHCSACSSVSESSKKQDVIRYGHPTRLWFVSKQLGLYCDEDSNLRAEPNLCSYITFQRVCDEKVKMSKDNGGCVVDDVRYGDLVRICLYKESNRRLALSDEAHPRGSIFSIGKTPIMLRWSTKTDSIFRVRRGRDDERKDSILTTFVLENIEHPNLVISLHDSKPCLTSSTNSLLVARPATCPYKGNEESKLATVELQRNADSTSIIRVSTTSLSSSASSRTLRKRKRCIVEIRKFEISVMDRDLKELMLCNLEGVNATCVLETSKSQQRGICVLNLETKAVQIDSMIHERESKSNVIFQPTPSNSGDKVPFFSLLIDGEWHTRSNKIVWWTNEICTRLSELEFRHCPELLVRLDRMYASIGKFQRVMPSKITISTSRLCVEPLQINLSFDVDNNDVFVESITTLSVLAPILKILHALKLLIGSVRRAPLTLDGFYVANVHDSMDNTLTSMSRHFSSQLLSALYKTAGSMQVLGNPVGVLRAFRTFYSRAKL